MEEINKFGNDKIKEMIEEVKKIKFLERVCKKAEENYQDLKEKQDKIEDKESEDYKKAQIETEKKQKVFSALSKARKNKRKAVEDKIVKSKNEILTKLEEKRRFIQDNKDKNLDDKNLENLKSEKEKLEKEILLNDTSKEDFLKMSDDEKNTVKKAKENYLNNKSRINEIEDEIKTVTEMKKTLREEKPEDALSEISNLMSKIDKYFNLEGLERLNEKRENKENNKTQRTMADLYNEKGEFIGTGPRRKENQQVNDEEEKPTGNKDNEHNKNEETNQQVGNNSHSKDNDGPDLEETIQRAILEQRERQRLEREKRYTNEKLDSIVINDAQGILRYTSNGKEYELDINKIEKNKKQIYEKYQVKQIMKDYCKYVYNIFDKVRLNRGMDPKIVTAIVSKYNPDEKKYVGELEEYISSIINKKPFKFDLTHNLAGLNPLQKLARRTIVRREEKHGATILGKLFDKNKTLDLGKSKDNIDYETDKIIENAQKKMGKDVQKVETSSKIKKEDLDRFKYNVYVEKETKDKIAKTGKEFSEKEKYERGEEIEVEAEEK